MPLEPAVGDKYYVTWHELGRPITQGVVKVAGLGALIFDDADLHYALKYQEKAAFFIRRSKSLGDGMYVVVSREESA